MYLNMYYPRGQISITQPKGGGRGDRSYRPLSKPPLNTTENTLSFYIIKIINLNMSINDLRDHIILVIIYCFSKRNRSITRSPNISF